MSGDYTMKKKYLKVAPGLYRPCGHEDYAKLWEEEFQYLKVCWKCGTFWHIIKSATKNFTLDVLDDDMYGYKQIIFFPYPPVNYAKY